MFQAKRLCYHISMVLGGERPSHFEPELKTPQPEEEAGSLRPKELSTTEALLHPAGPAVDVSAESAIIAPPVEAVHEQKKAVHAADNANGGAINAKNLFTTSEPDKLQAHMETIFEDNKAA